MSSTLHSYRAMVAALYFTLLVPGLLKANDKKAEAEALLAKARDLSDIRCEGCPAFSLRARVRFYTSEQSTTWVRDGSCVLLWQSKSRWREEISFPDIHILCWGLGGQIWRDSDMEYPSLRVTQLVALMNFTARLMPIANVNLKIVEEKKPGTASRACVEWKGPLGPLALMCFDPDNGVLVLEDESGFTSEFVDHFVVGTKLFPRNLRVRQDRNPAVQAHVEELRLGPALDDALFVPTPKATLEPRCEGRPRVVPAKLLEIIRPDYPPAAKRAGIQGVVRGYGVVGSDGKLHSLEVVHSLSPDLDAAALAAWSRWRYSPTICGGVPVMVGTFLEVRFSLH